MKLQKLPPKKTDMKPEHQTFEKENHLNQISIMSLRSMLVFLGGVSMIIRLSHTDGDVFLTSHKKTHKPLSTPLGVHVAKIRNDNFCDCSDCADEVNWNCDTCGAFDGDDGEEATDVGSCPGWKNSVRSGARKGRDAENESPLLCVFLFWVGFVGQEDLHTVSLAETQSCWVSLLSKTFVMRYLFVPMISKNSTGLAFR